MTYCPSCGGNELKQSAARDWCHCGYEVRYHDTYAGDGLEDPLREIPLEDRKDAKAT